MSNINKQSNWWIGSDVRDRYYDPLTGLSNAPKGKDIFKLHGYQKAISNFVRIVTAQSIPVRFSTKNDSYTDGKTITLSGNIKDGNFDVAVGLALHEGSHVKLTEFTSMQRVLDLITDELVTLAETKGIRHYTLKSTLQSLLNVVEDRRIDKFIQTEAPGYQGYYSAMYDHYFNATVITKALQCKEWNEETLEHYMNHIINFINPERTLDLLVGLRGVWNILELGNIQRLQSTDDAMAIAYEMLEHIVNVLPIVPKEESKDSKDSNDQQEQEEGEGGSGGQGGNGNDEEDESEDGSGGGNDTDDSSNQMDDGSTADGENSKDKGGDTPELSDRQKEQLIKALEKQRDFLKGEPKKTNVSKDEKQLIEAIDTSDATMESVDYESSSYGKDTSEVLVVRKLNDVTLQTVIPSFRLGTYSQSKYESVVSEGMRFGKMLGKKLLIRNDDAVTTFNRQKKGRIDRRLLADLGVGSTQIFDQTFVTSSNDSDIHISIDASGSMGGDRWKNALKTAIAIAKAADMVGGINVRIDCRAFSVNPLLKNKDYSPIVVIMYDSKVNGLKHITKYFTKIGPTGGTPEGICFKAINKIINQSQRGVDSYFINFSDGEPNSQFVDVTAESVKNIKRAGIKVLSYFINESTSRTDRAYRTFTTMYKDSAELIDTNNVTQVAKTLNKLLSAKK